MANPEHLDIIKQGVKAWNRWRQKDAQLDLDERAGIYLERELRVADLNGADLAGANLAGANLGAADLRAANLSEAALAAADLRVALLSKANLSRTRLTQASLSGADLSGATLRGTFLYEADLKGADLSEAYLRHTNLNRANLSGADLTKAQLSATIFAHVDLSEVKGLHSVSHDGPSEISVSSIYLSKGNIPDIFLRDTGLPDSFIDYIHSLTKKPLDFYSCFISYSSKDGNFVRRLHADLQNNGVRCWFAEKDLKIGEKIRPRIDESIHLSD